MIPVSSLYLKDDLADVTFVVPNSHKEGTCLIPAHTLLISARSEMFRAMFYGNFGKPAVVEITDAESDDFKTFLKYFYCGYVELTNSNVFRVLYLAQKYLIEDLRKSCVIYIDGMTPDDTDASRLFVEAQRCGSVPKKFWSRLETESVAKSVIASSDFLQLDRTNLRKFLRNDKFVSNEVVIFARLKAWAEHQLRESDPEEPVTDARIRDYLGDDIWLVRYAQITIKGFSNGLSGDGCFTAEEKLDIFRYLGGGSKVRALVKQRLPLLNTNPRQRGPPRKNSWRDLPLLRTFPHHHVPSRQHCSSVVTRAPLPRASLIADPPAAEVPAGGGTSTHLLTNVGASRLAFKVKSSNNNEYRLWRVFGFVEPGAATPVQIIRLAGPPKEDKLVIQFAEVAAHATDAQAPFKTGPVAGEVVIPIKAE